MSAQAEHINVYEGDVLEGNLVAINRRLTSLNRRAKKLGMSPVGIEVGEPYQKRLRPAEQGGPARVETRVPIALVGNPPRIEGWRFVAKLDFFGGSDVPPLLLTMPGEEMPAEYREADPLHCDHCGNRRRRNAVYVLADGDDRHVQVGSRCLGDFLGETNSPERIIQWARILERMVDVVGNDDLDPKGASQSIGIELESYLSMVAALVRESGFVSRKQAEVSEGNSTALDALIAPSVIRSGHMRDPVTDHDRRMAQEALEWARNLSDDEVRNEYLFNLRSVAARGFIPERATGIAASMIPAYQRARDRERERAEEAERSGHFGEVGQRGEFVLTVERIRRKESAWGTQYHYHMRDPDGNRCIWFASRMAGFGENDEPVEEGLTYAVRGTVKKHDEYRGIKSTVINRCVFHGPAEQETEPEDEGAAMGM